MDIYRVIARNREHQQQQQQQTNERPIAWIGINKWSNNYQLIWLSSGQWLPRIELSDPPVHHHWAEWVPRRGENDKINFHDPLQELIHEEGNWKTNDTVPEIIDLSLLSVER